MDNYCQTFEHFNLEYCKSCSDIDKNDCAIYQFYSDHIQSEFSKMEEIYSKILYNHSKGSVKGICQMTSEQWEEYKEKLIKTGDNFDWTNICERLHQINNMEKVYSIEQTPLHLENIPLMIKINPLTEIINNFNQIIMAVVNKFPNETRFQTALRYIRERENNIGGIAKNVH